MDFGRIHDELGKLVCESFAKRSDERSQFLAELNRLMCLANLDSSGRFEPELDYVYCKVLCVLGIFEELPKGESLQSIYYKLTPFGQEFYKKIKS